MADIAKYDERLMIFDQQLSETDIESVNVLVNKHKDNAAFTQQLAIDASRLLTTSQERLAKQADAGFFKRFVGKFTGENKANHLQNQIDMLQMQRCAWYYLKQLQQQNLINSQSIVVIRNNLGTMNDYIIETRDFLEQAVDKINYRLIHVENQTKFNTWSLQIEANKRQFKAMPRNVLVVQLTSSFMRSHRDIELTYCDLNYLVVTLEKLGVNCDESEQLLDFIIDLIDQIAISGIERYREILALEFGEYVVDSNFIQNNISGIAINAMYFLSDHYERIIDLTDGQTDAERERIISKFFGHEFSGLSTSYCVRDLIAELISGSTLAVDLYKVANGIRESKPFVDANETESSEVLSLSETLSFSLPDISEHSFFDNTNNEDERLNYLRLLGLVIDGSSTLNNAGLEFLSLLSEKAVCQNICREILCLADSPTKMQDFLPLLRSLLNDNEKTYAWLADALFLLALCQRKLESSQVAMIVATLKPAQFRENLQHILTLINENEEALLHDAAVRLAPQCEGWKNIIRYRSIRFDEFYCDIGDKLNSANVAATELSVDLLSVNMQAGEHSIYMEPFEGGFFSKIGSVASASVCALGRSSALSSLNEIRNKACKLISEHAAALNKANGMINSFNMPTIEFNNQISYSNYELDNSVTNDDWYEQFCFFESKLSDTLSAFADACSDADDQLNYFRAGDFERSIVKIKQQNIDALKLSKQQKLLESQSIMIDIDGKPHRVGIEWRDVEASPCDPEKIRYIKTDGKVWLIVDNDDVFYRSENQTHWETVHPIASNDDPYVRKLDIVNGIWILMVGYSGGIYYSDDALTWQQSSYPESLPQHSELTRTEDVVYFNGQWLWRFTEREKYQYTEKGILFDSNETSSYDKTIIFCADELDSRWYRWNQSPNFSEGIVVECLRALPGTECLLSFCKYDYFYTSRKKKNNAPPFVSYLTPRRDWRNCSWDTINDNHDDIVIARINNKLSCSYSNKTLVSEKGYEWNLNPEMHQFIDCFHLEKVSLLPSRHNSQIIYLNKDDGAFKELMLDDGEWKYLCANDQGVLGVYAPNCHETFLRAGRLIFKSES